MEQDVKELESRLQQAYTHMENGEAPDQHTQAEWERMLQDQFKRKHRLIEKMNVMTHCYKNGPCLSTAAMNGWREGYSIANH